MWAAQIDALIVDVRVIAPRSARLRPQPRPEPGGTPVVPFTMEQFADDLAAHVDALERREPVVYCGLSMGGYIALQFRRKYAEPGCGVVLCDTRPSPTRPRRPPPGVRWPTRAPRGACPAGRNDAAASCSAKRPPTAARTGRPVRRTIMANSPPGIAAAARGMAERPDMTASLGGDPLSDAARGRRRRHDFAAGRDARHCRRDSRAKLVEIPAAGHMSPMENPPAVNGRHRRVPGDAVAGLQRSRRISVASPSRSR